MQRSTIGSVFDRILNGLACLAGVLLLFITVSVSVAVVLRYINFKPPVWVLQYTEYALLWITFLGAAWLLREGGHIRIDTLLLMFSPRVQRGVDLFNQLLGFVVSAVIFAIGTWLTIDLYRRNIMDVRGVTLPKFALFAIIPLGGLTLALQFARNFFSQWKESRKESS